MFNSLEILYMVIAIILLPIGTFLSMILWRVYKMMDRIERIMSFVDRLVTYSKDLEKIPLAIIEKFMK
jgi:uncharacterized protein YoxC